MAGMSMDIDVANARVYAESGIVERGVLVVRGGVVRKISPIEEWRSDGAVQAVDAGGRTLVPGFVDVHVHGGGGFDVMSGKRAELEGMSLYHASRGTTALLATTLTASHRELLEVLRAVRETMDAGVPGSEIAGVHLEGPYLNPVRCGAQNPEHIRPVSLGELEQYWTASGGLLRLVTLAPEHPKSLDAIRWLTARGATVSIGHTDADYRVMQEAVLAGARHVTHLFNGMRPLHHREPGVAGAALAIDELAVELICDGIHVHPALIDYVWRTKPRSQVVLVTDAISASGLADGAYEIGGLPAVLSDGIMRLATADGSEGSLAGSTLSMNAAMRNLRGWTGASLEEALQPLSANPARQAGLHARKGTLAPGKDADFVLLADDGGVEETWVRGKRVYKA